MVSFSIQPARPAGAGGPPRRMPRGVRWQLALLGVLSLAALGWLAWSDLPYEQDQGSKAAKIIDLAAHDTWLSPAAGEPVYRDDLFSFYYVVASLIYEATGGDVFGVMNRLSAVLGAICFTALAWAWYRGFGISPLAAWPVLVSMPVLVVTFLYGNEVALAMALLALALLGATLRGSRALYLSPICMVLACFARADMVLVVPYWIGWCAYVSGPHRDRRAVVRALAPLLAVFGATTVVYWLALLGRLPEPIGAFDWALIPLLFAAYVTQAFCASIALIGAAGALYLIVTRHRYAWVHLLLLIPLAFYASNLSSPKYVIVLALFYGLPTAFLLTRFPRLRLPAAAAILPWWVFAVSPGGIHGPATGPEWYLPTADGALPTGAYVTSYDFIRRGVYQERYRAEIDSLADVLRLPRPADGSRLDLVGNFNTHFLTLASARQLESPKAWERYVRRWEDQVPEAAEAPAFVMVQPSYLQFERLEPAGRARLRAHLLEGKCRAVSGHGAPFPGVIEVHPGAPVDRARGGDLCRRILFADAYYAGHLSARRSAFHAPYRPLVWIPRPAAELDEAGAVYADAEYVAVAHPGERGEIFSLMLPAPYYHQHEDPRP